MKIPPQNTKSKHNLFSLVILHSWEFFELLFDNISEILHTGRRSLIWVNLVKSLRHSFAFVLISLNIVIVIEITIGSSSYFEPCDLGNIRG